MHPDQSCDNKSVIRFIMLILVEKLFMLSYAWLVCSQQNRGLCLQSVT
jgi:hypothetical protein